MSRPATRISIVPATTRDQAMPLTWSKQATATLSPHASGNATVSGGGDFHVAGYATHSRPDRITEVGWHVTISAFTGWLGEQVTGTADGALGFALVGVVGAHLMWERWAHPRG